jgi:hypothetical protein
MTTQEFLGLLALVLLFGGSAIMAWGLGLLIGEKKKFGWLPLLVGLCMVACLFVFHNMIDPQPMSDMQFHSSGWLD